MKRMGMDLFENPIPTGWSEIGSDWINTNLLLERIKWVNTLAYSDEAEANTFIDPVALFSRYGFLTAEGIVGFLMDILFDDDFSDLDYTTAMEVLTADGGFDIQMPDADEKLRQLLGTVMSYPGANYQ